MQRKLFFILSAICLAVLISLSSAQAQTLHRYEANIPFDFSLGNQTYKAGDYSIDVRNNAGNVSLTMLDSNHKIAEKMFLTDNRSVSRNDKSSLIFNKVDGSYILSRMTTPGFGLKIPNTYVTISVSAKNSNSAKQKTETVAVLLK